MKDGDNMTIGLASDHRGYKSKKFLKDSLYKYDVIDYGTDTENSVDFPIYAKKIRNCYSKWWSLIWGIAICGTGIGMSITLNKMKVYIVLKFQMRVKLFLCKAHKWC